ncbi:MAG: helix-turn-helix domain-containing protein, partial [Candidatus Enterosoma sp.]|nr:helix-turn-helix domain-containing protein [Candidatus Enterosoma sp.]
MNIKIANRLVELRKKNGLSQEQLAEQLGLSRQAVSKWERAEASPDTDNLICLAKIYGISLDELLADDESIDDIRRNVKEQQKEKGFEFNGEDCEVHISNDGIHVKDDDGNTVHITSKDGIVVTSKDGEEKKPKNVVLGAISGLTVFAVV